MMDIETLNQLSVNELEDFLSGKILLPGEESYNKAREIWNGIVDHFPAMICLCETVNDVQVAVILAREKKLRLSVLGGGHDWKGRGLIDKGLVIDLSRMKKIEIDVHTGIADIEGGVNAGELVSAADPFNLVAVTGSAKAVGMAGFTLSGGYGVLSSKYGLSLDNLLGADLVLADGSLVTASKTENPDLFWAIRGGGGNFGVVTSMRIKLHVAGPLLAGIMMFAWPEAETVLKGYTNIMQSAPDELGLFAGVITSAAGGPVLFLMPVWNGDLEEGNRSIELIRQLGTPFMDQIAEMRLKDLLDMVDAFTVNGNHYEVKTRWLSELVPEVLNEVIKAGENRTSLSSIINFHHLHGAGARVSLSETAFGLRKEHFMLEIVAAWPPEDAAKADLHKKWANELSDSIAKYSLPGGYPNMLGTDEHEQIANAYGSNYPRLKSIKDAVDPDGVFSAQPL